MNSDTLERKDWKGGQLLAFSAIDGVTDYQNGLTARTAFVGPGIDVMLPARCRVSFSVPTDTSNTVAGDRFGRMEHPAARQGVRRPAAHSALRPDRRHRRTP